MSSRSVLAALLAALVLAGAAAASRAALEPVAARPPSYRDPAWLPDGKVLRVSAFGQRLLLADLYWLRTVQYIGETVMSKQDRWDALYPLADIVTDLDPRYGYAYQVAGSNLAGLAHRYDEAERILQKGMRNVPDRWSLPFVHATNKFVLEGDFATAAEYARRAAVVGKRPHLALLAANLSAIADTDQEYAASLEFLDQMMEQAGTPELAQELHDRRVRIATFMALSEVEKAIAAFRERNGRLPLSLDELAPTFLRAIPADPSGGVLWYEPATGAVASSVIGKRELLRVSR